MSKNDLNFELNLLPVISLLAVLICFLLLTTAWIHIGSVDVAQAIGGQSTTETKPKPEVWVTIHKERMSFTLKNVSKKNKKLQRRKPFPSKFARRYYAQLKKNITNLNTALITPTRGTSYGKIIETIDNLKAEKITEVGVNPL